MALASAITEAMVRWASASLKALSSRGVAPANSRSATAFEPWGNSASASSTRHGFGATPPIATAPVPSLPITAATETSAKA